MSFLKQDESFRPLYNRFKRMRENQQLILYGDRQWIIHVYLFYEQYRNFIAVISKGHRVNGRIWCFIVDHNPRCNNVLDIPNSK